MPASRSETLLGGLEHFGMRLGLGRVRRLLAGLGDPHLAVPAVLVAGTNGKGSTAALLAAICRAAGYRTALYTSPHLETVTERLTVGGKPIDDRRLAAHLEQCLAAAEAIGEPPTYFEALTVAAFLHFRAAAADLTILEVGLGGRLDATNASEPELSIITSIGLDHEQHLGDTAAAVAREKSGILRQGRPMVAWAEEPEVRRALCERAAEVGALPELVDAAGISTSTTPATYPQQVRLATPRSTHDLELFLAGEHQLANLSLAVRAAEILAERGWPALDALAIRHGAASCRWPGRLEWVDLGDGRRVLLDAAHNSTGLAALVSFLEQLAEPPDLLFGALAEKSIDGVLPRLATVVDRVFLTRPPERRAADPERWSTLFEGRPIHIEPALARALDLALEAGAGTLLASGSIYLVGRVRSLLRERFGVPEPVV